MPQQVKELAMKKCVFVRVITDQGALFQCKYCKRIMTRQLDGECKR